MSAVEVLLVAASIAGAVAVGTVVMRRRRPNRPTRPARDPFTLSEPWRQLVQGALRAERRVRDTVAGAPPGPLRDRLESIASRVGTALDDTWQIALQGDAVDDAVRGLDPTRLRSQLELAEARGEADPTTVESLRRQLDTVDRLRARSDEAVARLRRSQTRLDELAARAAEVALGAADTDTYEHDVDDLVIELEALRLAMEDIQAQ
ncbi:MAG: hypothetical protein MUE78_09850 [Ilumatobacteraceae bacterium]|jgi:hypothetical protein|nr:hypothetical protein [Ilumatobacteraceae bacterium]